MVVVVEEAKGWVREVEIASNFVSDTQHLR